MNSTTSKSFAVAGADFDPSLTMKLTAGDKVLVEVNGTRVYSTSDCPILSDNYWVVISNSPPLARGQIPTSEHKLVLYNAQEKHTLVLHYKNLLELSPRQPAVFREFDPKLATDEQGNAAMTYIFVQMISHWIKEKNVRTEYPPYYRADSRLMFDNEDISKLILEQWQGILSNFTQPGWDQKSVCRLALRAFVTPTDIQMIVAGKGNRLGISKLSRIHEVLHWLPYQITNGKLMDIKDVLNAETYEGDGHASNSSTDANT